MLQLQPRSPKRMWKGFNRQRGYDNMAALQTVRVANCPSLLLYAPSRCSMTQPSIQRVWHVNAASAVLQANVTNCDHGGTCMAFMTSSVMVREASSETQTCYRHAICTRHACQHDRQLFQTGLK